MFDVGFWELALIGVVALLIIGPERLPAAARTAGMWVGKGRRMLREVKADVDRELREHDVAGLGQLDELKKDMQSAGAKFKDAAEEIGKSADIKADVEAAVSLKESFAQSSPADKSAQPKRKTKTKTKSAKKKTGKKTAKARKSKKKISKKTATKTAQTTKVTKATAKKRKPVKKRK